MPELTRSQTPNGRNVFISVESVQDALATLIHDHSKNATTVPLEALQLVEEWLLHPDRPTFEMPRAMAVQELLLSLITTIHTEIRQAFELSAAQPTETHDEVLQIIEANARKSSSQLLIWDWLYYRYVRDDLALSQDDFCKAAHVDERTLRRYQPRALKKLTERLIYQEWEIRSSQRRRRLLALLPPPPATPLIERDAYINRLNNLLQTQPYAHVLVSGAPGIGKTAVVRAVLQTQIAHDRFDHVVWLNSPPSLDFVFQSVTAHLLPEISSFSLAECAAEYAIAIVIDDADYLGENAKALENLFHQLRGITVFLVANAFAADARTTLSIRLPELTQAGVRTLIDALLKLYAKDDAEAYPIADAVWQRGGGNPSAVKLLYAAAALDRFENETLEKIFYDLYSQLDAPLENILLLLSCLPPRPIPFDVLPGFCAEIRAHQVVRLAQIGLIESATAEEGQGYLIPTALRQFIRARAWKDEHFAGKLNSVFKLICDRIGTSAMDDEIAEYLLLENRVSESTLRRAWIEHYWRTGMQRGRWTEWYTIVDAFCTDEVQDDSDPLLIARAALQRRLGAWDNCERTLTHVIRAAGYAGKFEVQSAAILELAILCRSRGDLNAASNYLLQIARHITKLTPTAARTLRIEQTQLALARLNGVLALDLLRHLDQDGYVLALKAEALMLNTEYRSALDAAEKALLLLKKDHSALARLHTIMARVYEAVGDLRAAQQHFAAALTLFEQLNERFALSRAKANVATIMIRLGNYDDAARLLHDAQMTQERLNDRIGLEITRYNLKLLDRSRLN